MTEAMIRVRNVTKRYQRGGEALVPLGLVRHHHTT